MPLLTFYLVYPLGLITAILIVPILYARYGIPVVEALNFPADISSDATDWAYHGLSLLFFRDPPYPAFFPDRIRELEYFSFVDQLTSYLYLGFMVFGAVGLTYDHAWAIKDLRQKISNCRLKLTKYKTRPQVVHLFQTLERSLNRYTWVVLALAMIVPLGCSWIFFSLASLLRGEWAAFFWCAVVVAFILAVLKITVGVLINPGELIYKVSEQIEELRRLYQEYEVAERELEVRKARGNVH